MQVYDKPLPVNIRHYKKNENKLTQDCCQTNITRPPAAFFDSQMCLFKKIQYQPLQRYANAVTGIFCMKCVNTFQESSPLIVPKFTYY